MLRNAWRYRGIIRRWRPDMLVTCNWGAIEFALANLVPVTKHMHIVDGFGPEERASQLPRRAFVRRVALGRTPVVLPSRNLVRIAREVWKLPPQVIRYVPNGIDLGRFVTDGTARGGGEPIIGTVAALRPEKNVGRLIRAFARLPAGRLVIVGDGAERPALTELAAALGIGDRVVFEGHRSDTPALYARFDIFALSSDTEQMPLSVIEAMASGLPVVSTDVGDVKLMVGDSNTRFITPLTDTALADALTSLAGDRGLRQRLGADNLRKARRDFDQTAMFAAYEELWRGNAGAT
jgi:glycosyltransferase involved in cell wall biosynthesis